MLASMLHAQVTHENSKKKPNAYMYHFDTFIIATQKMTLFFVSKMIKSLR